MSTQTNRLLLTWKPHGHAKGGRWCKKIDGNRVYFGSANTCLSEEERQLYQRKLKCKQRESAETGRAPEYAGWAMAIEESHEQAEIKRQQDIIDEARRLNGGKVVGQTRPALPTLIDDYLSEADRRHLVTLKHPETLPPKRRLGASALKAIRDQLKPFKKWVESNRASLGADIAATEKIFCGMM